MPAALEALNSSWLHQRSVVAYVPCEPHQTMTWLSDEPLHRALAEIHVPYDNV
jgi:hypothetical protein